MDYVHVTLLKESTNEEPVGCDLDYPVILLFISELAKHCTILYLLTIRYHVLAIPRHRGQGRKH